MVFLRRLIGAAMLDAGIYEDVEADQSATLQSLIVVVLASLAAGIGATGLYDTPATVRFFAVASVVALLTWSTWAVVTLQLGARVLPARQTSADMGQLLRTLGFSAAPALILVFAVLPRMQTPVFVIAIAWTIVASVVAVRHALDYESAGRAVAVCALGWLLTFIFVAVIGMVFGSAVAAS
jgi:Yip1 domain